MRKHFPDTQTRRTPDERAIRVAMAQAECRSLSALARLAGLSDGHIRAIVSRGYCPGEESARRIAEALAASVDELFPVATP
jgi:hypothetical protein